MGGDVGGAAARALRQICRGQAGPERPRLRRPAALLGADDARSGASPPSSASASITCWSTNTRTPTACSPRSCSALKPDGARADRRRRRRAVDLFVPRRDRPQHPRFPRELLPARRHRHARPQLSLDRADPRRRQRRHRRSDRALHQGSVDRPRSPTAGRSSSPCATRRRRRSTSSSTSSRAREGGVALKQQAVLFRTSHHSGPLEIELTRRNIPFVKYGGLKFLDAAHVKDMLALLRWAENPRDRVAGFRVLQLLPGIGPGIAGKILDAINDAAAPVRGARPRCPPRRAPQAGPASSSGRAISPRRATGRPPSAAPASGTSRSSTRRTRMPQVRLLDLLQLEQIHARFSAKMQSKLIQPESNPRRLRLSLPRKPKAGVNGAARKQYTLQLKTEVDWSEDLHPTDEEIATLYGKNDEEGATVSTPDPDLTYDEESDLATTYKRKGSTARRVPGKRRKSLQAKKITRKKNTRSRQLPLTSFTVDYTTPTQPGEMASNSKSDSQTIKEQLTSTNVKNTSAELPSNAHLSNQVGRTNEQREVIEISSASITPISSSSDNHIDVLRSEAYRYRVIGTGSDGRGKVVGQKLVDALRGVELHTQLRTAIETTLHSAHRDQDGIQKEFASPSSRIMTNDKSQSQASLISHGAIEQEHENNEILKPVQVSQDPLQMTQFTKSPREIAGQSTSRQNDQQPGSLPHPLGSVDTPNYPQKENGMGRSSKSSSGSAVGHVNVPFQLEKNRNGVTPESQRPLLTQQTPLQTSAPLLEVVKTAPKSTIVDSNGSPRLIKEANFADQIRSELKHMQKPRDAKILPSSSSDYEQNSDRSSFDSSEDELVWSKYQRDMFLEYGLETALMKKSTQYAPIKDSATKDENNKDSRHEVARNSPAENRPDACDVRANKASMVAPTFPQRNTEEPGADTGQHAVVPLSTEMSGTLQALSEAQQFSQSSGSDPLDWILALQTAQRSAQDLLLETNQVGLADRKPLSLGLSTTNLFKAPIESIGSRTGDYSPGASNLSTGMQSYS